MCGSRPRNANSAVRKRKEKPKVGTGRTNTTIAPPLHCSLTGRSSAAGRNASALLYCIEHFGLGAARTAAGSGGAEQWMASCREVAKGGGRDAHLSLLPPPYQ